jgi:putative hydrolase of the HAD superfamily
MPPYAALAFDLGNVLIRVDHGRFCRQLAQMAGLEASEVYARIFDRGLEPAFDCGRLSPEEFYRQVLACVPAPLPYPEFCRLWCDIFAPLPEMEEVLVRLKIRMPLFLVSNTNALHFPYIWERFPLIHGFAGYILSYRVGSRKPEPGFYQALLRELPCPPQACLFIDDKLPFVEAARGHGLAAWHFQAPPALVRHLEEAGVLPPAGPSPGPRG